MFIIGKDYIFKIRNSSSSRGFSMYTGVVTDISLNKVFITTVKQEHISIDISEILHSFEKLN